MSSNTNGPRITWKPSQQTDNGWRITQSFRHNTQHSLSLSTRHYHRLPSRHGNRSLPFITQHYTSRFSPIIGSLVILLSSKWNLEYKNCFVCCLSLVLFTEFKPNESVIVCVIVALVDLPSFTTFSALWIHNLHFITFCQLNWQSWRFPFSPYFDLNAWGEDNHDTQCVTFITNARAFISGPMLKSHLINNSAMELFVDLGYCHLKCNFQTSPPCLNTSTCTHIHTHARQGCCDNLRSAGAKI